MGTVLFNVSYGFSHQKLSRSPGVLVLPSQSSPNAQKMLRPFTVGLVVLARLSTRVSVSREREKSVNRRSSFEVLVLITQFFAIVYLYDTLFTTVPMPFPRCTNLYDVSWLRTPLMRMHRS